MSVVSFLHDLGIIPNEATGLENDHNLLQGQRFMEYGRVYASAARPHLQLLEISSSPEINSIVETFNDDNSMISNKTVDNSSISGIEKEFNRTLNKYTAAYKNFTETTLNGKNSKEVIQSYFSNLQRLNDKLISLAKAMGNELVVKDKNLKGGLDNHQLKLKTYISKLNEDRRNIMNINKGYDTVSGEYINSELNLVSNQYNYIVWFILSITVISITIHVIMSNSVSDNVGNIILIVSLISLFLIVKNLYIIYK
jgi:hypothetical protein